jgi:putative transposase
MYARGMIVLDMQAMLLELYEIEVSEALISSVTDAVLDDVRAWQSRPLDLIYPIVYFDCIVVKSRQDGKVSNKAVILLWLSPRKVKKNCWASGSLRTKEQSSGLAS